MRVRHAPGMPGTFPRHRLQRKLLVSDPSMHHATHVSWCMSGSLTHGGRGKRSRRKCNPQFNVSGKRPMVFSVLLDYQQSYCPKVCPRRIQFRHKRFLDCGTTFYPWSMWLVEGAHCGPVHCRPLCIGRELISQISAQIFQSKTRCSNTWVSRSNKIRTHVDSYWNSICTYDTFLFSVRVSLTLYLSSYAQETWNLFSATYFLQGVAPFWPGGERNI